MGGKSVHGKVMGKLDRTPNGKFMGHGEAMYHWLPLMLNWCYGERGLTDMLENAQKWCVVRAAMDLANNAKWLTVSTKDVEPMNLWGMRAAEKWAKRRDVLIEAANKLKEIG